MADNPWDPLGLGLGGMGSATPSLGGAGGLAPLPSFAQPAAGGLGGPTASPASAPSAPSAPPMGAQPAPAAPVAPMGGGAGLTPDPHVMFQNFQQTDAWKNMAPPMQAMLTSLMQKHGQAAPMQPMAAPDTGDIVKPGANAGNAMAQGFGKSFKMPSMDSINAQKPTFMGQPTSGNNPWGSDQNPYG